MEFSNSRSKKWLLLAFILPVLILLGMAFKPFVTLTTGQEIAVKTIPVDPTDLLYGDYVDLRYQVEEIPVFLFDKELTKKYKPESYNHDETSVYIWLENGDENIYDVSRVSEQKPEKGVYLKGTLSGTPVELDDEPAYYDIDLDVDTISKYYLEEGTGKQLEEQANKGQLVAHMKWKDGYVILTSVEMP